MNKQTRNLIIAGLAVAIIIGVLSPFIASTNPDGLDKSAEILNQNVMVNPGYWHAPFDQYMVSQLGDGPLAGIAALLIGVFITIGLAFGVTAILRRRRTVNN